MPTHKTVTLHSAQYLFNRSIDGYSISNQVLNIYLLTQSAMVTEDLNHMDLCSDMKIIFKLFAYQFV